MKTRLFWYPGPATMRPGWAYRFTGAQGYEAISMLPGSVERDASDAKILAAAQEDARLHHLRLSFYVDRGDG